MKYLGGKQRLGKHLAPFLKQLIETTTHPIHTYLEPFCGALGILQHMTDTHLPIYASDYHPDLIALWQYLQSSDFPSFPTQITELDYLYYKHQIPSPHPIKGFVGFGMSFSGKFFAGYAEKYLNGKQEHFCQEAIHSMKRLHPLLTHVHFQCQDYLELHPQHSFIYCDPPYTYQKNPIKYRRDVKHYDTFDTPLFWETMRKWSQNNLVVISERDAPPDFVSIWERQCHRSVSQSSKTRYKNPSAKNGIEKLYIHQSLLTHLPNKNAINKSYTLINEIKT